MLRGINIFRQGVARPLESGSSGVEEMSWSGLLYRGASGAFLVQVGGAGLSLVVNIILARYLGASQYGVYTLALSWVSVFSVFILIGQSTSVLRLVPTYVYQEKWRKLQGLRKRASQIVLLAGVVIALAGACVVYLLRAKLGEALELTFFASFILLPILGQLQLNGAFLQAFKRAASSGVFNSLLRPAIFLILVLVIPLIFGARLDAPTAMFATVVTVLATTGLSRLFLMHVWPAQSKEVRPSYETRMWLRLGRQLCFLAVIGIVLNRVDVLILGWLAGIVVVGPYYASVQLAATVMYGLSAVNTILAPMIAECYAAGDHAKLGRLVHRAAWITFIVTSVISLTLAIAGRWVLELFGHGFSAAYVPLLIILGGQCVNAATGPVGFLMTMTRFESQAPYIFGGGAVLNVLLSVLLIPFSGIIGAATATAVAMIAWNLVALVFVRRRLGVNPTVFPLPVR